MRRSSLDANEYFEFTALPTVEGITPASGNVGGQFLTITGTGFSSELSNNTVKVDGNDCAVTSASNSEIKCTLAAKDAALSTLLTTDSSGQVNGHFSGAGLKYTRYTYSSAIWSLTNFMTAVRAADTATLGSPVEEGFRADMREASVYAENEAQTWSGYFTAPVTGTYTFRVTADDRAAFYIQTTYGSAEPPATPLLETNVNQYMFYPFIVDAGTDSGTADLVAGRSYYIEAYHLNYGGTGFFNLAVEVPNTDATALHQVYQVQNVTISAPIQK